jgi:hypothetical protein
VNREARKSACVVNSCIFDLRMSFPILPGRVKVGILAPLFKSTRFSFFSLLLAAQTPAFVPDPSEGFCTFQNCNASASKPECPEPNYLCRLSMIGPTSFVYLDHTDRLSLAHGDPTSTLAKAVRLGLQYHWKMSRRRRRQHQYHLAS